MNTLLNYFQELANKNWSGEIDVMASQGNATILMRDGEFILAYRPIGRSFEKFQKIEWLKTPPQNELEKLDNWMVFIEVLLEGNEDKSIQLANFLKIDRMELFYRMFLWSNIEIASREFKVGPLGSTKLSFYTPKNLNSMLDEAKRRLDNWPQFQERLDSSNRIFVSKINFGPKLVQELESMDTESFRSEDSTEFEGRHPIPTLPYTLEEIELLRECDGRNTVQDLIRRSEHGEYQTIKRLISLWNKKAISPKDEEDAYAESTPLAAKLSVKDVGILIFMIMLISSFFVLTDILNPHSAAHHRAAVTVTRGLESFRTSEGTYPLTLNVLVRRGLISKIDITNLEYSLIHASRYKLSTGK